MEDTMEIVVVRQSIKKVETVTLEIRGDVLAEILEYPGFDVQSFGLSSKSQKTYVFTLVKEQDLPPDEEEEIMEDESEKDDENGPLEHDEDEDEEA